MALTSNSLSWVIQPVFWRIEFESFIFIWSYYDPWDIIRSLIDIGIVAYVFYRVLA